MKFTHGGTQLPGGVLMLLNKLMVTKRDVTDVTDVTDTFFSYVQRPAL